MIRVLHIIIGLNTGGAEIMLYKLVTEMARSYPNIESEVVSLTGLGPVGERLRAAGVTVYTMNLDSRPVTGSVRLKRVLEHTNPDVIQSWMYHADLVGSLVVNLFCKRPLIWNIRNSQIGSGVVRRALVKILALLSRRVPDQIVCNSYAGCLAHEKIGYDGSKMCIIPNGFDTDVFAPDRAKGKALRDSLGIREDQLVVGLVGRYAPEKDHDLFLRACGHLVGKGRNITLVMCGPGVDSGNDSLMRKVELYGLADRCYLLGARHDIPLIMNALDVFVLSSYTEGFPNVVGEAMACGVPCIVTNVGDAARIVGNTGTVIPPRNVESLINALEEHLSLGSELRERLGSQARQRILNHYSLDAIANHYVSLYKQVVAECSAGYL